MKKVSILFLANSFADDTIQYMPNIAKELGYDLDLYNLYIGGCPIDTHIDNLKNNNHVYELRIYNEEQDCWETKYDVSSSDFILTRKWDFVVLQQSSYFSGLENGLDHIETLIELVKEKLVSKDTKLIWNMTWAYPKYSDLEVFVEHFKCDQQKMYESIVKNVKDKIVPNKDFVTIIPNGTALMNARKHVKDEVLHRDGFHLSYQPGRYLAGLTAIATIFNEDVNKVKFRPDPITDELRDIFKRCAMNAAKYPFEIKE